MASTSLSPAARCAENIALLYLLHHVPAPPSYNEIDMGQVRHGNYTWSFDQERILASTLAFLSNIMEDPEHVPALCLEECVESASLNVLLAVNKSHWEDGKNILLNLQHRFDELFAILSEVSEARDETRAIERRLFTAIVSMCSCRILGRLRLAGKKRSTTKQPFKEVLGRAIDALKLIDQQALERLSIKSFLERAKDVIKLVDSWMKHQKPAELENIVEGIYRLKKVAAFRTLLDSIPNREMDPSSRQNLANIVNKVSRYWESARYLYRTSRKTPLLRRAKVVAIDLPKEAFYRISSIHTPLLASTITRISTNHRKPDFTYLCSILNPSDLELNEQFVDQTKRSLSKAKIHAEIQLVLHYELTLSRLPPRVVCSSKDACFLCNTFIRMHGKMHTPGSHGRLYPGWRLPSMPKFSDLQLRFNTALEEQIKESLQTLLSRKEKTKYPHPNESTLLLLQSSTSTLRTTSALIEAASRQAISTTESMAKTAITPSKNLEPAEERISTSPSEEIETVPSILESEHSIAVEGDEIPETIKMATPRTSPSPGSEPLAISPSNGTSDACMLVQGIPHTVRVATTRNPLFHTTGVLEIHIEYAAEAEPSDEQREKSEIAYSIEWLSIDTARELVQNCAATLVDVETMELQTSRELENRDGILVMAGGNVVRILF
ncbi:hypothetical protein SVAN01_07915 [Stagonosporopsis vannaccii]|nr:hypothetical protein SVAN01_07915 [Stagonosporopsis vannaccii]